MNDEIATFFQSLDSMQQKDVQIAPKRVFSRTSLTNVTNNKLIPYQRAHTVKLINILLNRFVALDSSDTGVGKTYIAAAVCSELGRKPLIICPKSLMYNWRTVMAYMGVQWYDIVNYETLRSGKTYRNNKLKTRIHASYIEPVKQNNIMDDAYKWNLPDDTIVIFDEVHRCKDSESDNGKLLVSTLQLINSKIPILLLSATISDKISDMKILFCLFKLIPNIRNYQHYLKLLRHKYPEYRQNVNNTNDATKARNNSQAKMIYQEIQEFTARLNIKDLGDSFPQNQVTGQLYTTSKTDDILRAYAKMAKYYKILGTDTGNYYIGKIQKLKQAIEYYKIPIFIEQIESYLEENKSVIVFVNFLKTLRYLSDHFSTKCLIYGSQTPDARQQSIDLFQSNQERLIICQIRAGGTGISLHDLHGDYARIALLSCPDSALTLLQALGRAARAGAKSNVIQRIIFVAGIKYEERVMNNINNKLSNLSLINDHDMNGYTFPIHNMASPE